MREIVFDTETTGFDPFTGDRVIEIGCVVLENKVVVPGETFHVYCNPEREVPDSARKVHGLSNEFLSDKPLIASVLDDFLAFIGDEAPLIAHNADFDMKFMNWELQNAGKPIVPVTRFKDTLRIARTKFPGASNSLDALCRRFGIENGHRTLHGALLDSEILAEVYVELEGGRQTGLNLATEKTGSSVQRERKQREPRHFNLSAEDGDKHAEFIKNLDNPIWAR